MLQKTRGIILKVTAFGESSVVARIYTEQYGLQGYLINSVRKKNAKVKQHVLNPMTPVDLVVYYKERRGLQRVSEIVSNPVLQHIPFDVKRSSVVFFLAEVLNKSLHEEESNPLLFEFIFSSVLLLDSQQPLNLNFHLHFLVRLTKYLGFYPNVSDGDYFNLQEGNFQSVLPQHFYYLEPPLSDFLKQILEANSSFEAIVEMPLQEKRLLTEKILEYYQLHLPDFKAVQSHKVLELIWG